MRVCFITPRKYFREFCSRYSDYYLLLSHWIESERDLTPFRDRYVILDNGAYENGKPHEIDRYVQLIERLRPDEIVTPDVRFDAQATITATCQFLKDHHESRYKYLAPVQGTNWEEWTHCYRTFLDDPKVDVIGITDVPVEKTVLSYAYDKLPAAFSRVYAMEYLDRLGLLQKPIHILGSVDPAELPWLRYFRHARSTDSKIAFWNGVSNDRLHPTSGLRRGSIKIESMTWDWSGQLTLRQRRNILYNIAVFKALAGGGKK